MNFPELSEYLKVKHNMPSNWEVYAFESLPAGPLGRTHVQISGGSPTGKEGNHSTWEGCLDSASFVLSFEEIAQAKAAL